MQIGGVRQIKLQEADFREAKFICAEVARLIAESRSYYRMYDANLSRSTVPLDKKIIARVIFVLHAGVYLNIPLLLY